MTLPFCQDGQATLHSFQDDDLGYALSLKYDSISGLRTYNGQIILSEIANLHGWPDSLGEIPSDADLEKICDDYRITVNALEYQRKRAEEYPTIVDQLDDLYHNGIDGWKATIKVTKDKYPK